jgi:hypothetical protein
VPVVVVCSVVVAVVAVVVVAVEVLLFPDEPDIKPE